MDTILEEVVGARHGEDVLGRLLGREARDLGAERPLLDRPDGRRRAVGTIVAPVVADGDLNRAAATAVHVVVVPNPGGLHGDVQVDLHVRLLDPDMAVAFAHEEFANESAGLNLDDVRVLAPGSVYEEFHWNLP